MAEHKEYNGKVEVFNGNLHQEFFDPPQKYYDLVRARLFPGATPPETKAACPTIDLEGQIPTESGGR